MGEPSPSSERDPAPRLGRGLIRFAVGALAFAAVLVLWPTSRARTLVALVVPLITLIAVGVWWLREPTLSRRLKLTGCGLGLAAAVFLGVAPDFPASLIALLWGLPATLALTLCALYLCRGRSARSRALVVGAVFLASLAVWPLLGADGASGQMMPNLVWRWQAPASMATETVAAVPGASVEAARVTERDWPGFRGFDRRGAVPEAIAAQLDLEWSARPPRELWRRAIGQGWSSFAAVGSLACTQDQAGERERVLCLDARTGATLWQHWDERRFEELAGGPGPRATPLIHDGRLYALGAAGTLNSLDVRSGELLWSVDLAGDAGDAPEWGFSSSPVILGDLVYVSPAGVGGIRVLALDRESGQRVWRAEGAEPGYGSVQPAVLGGVAQLLLLDGEGLVSYEPLTGQRLWAHGWPTQVPKVAQPHALGGDTVVVGMGYGRGTRSLRVEWKAARWSVEEIWSTSRFKPKFNDFVVRDGYLFGLDEGILACVEVATGERLWKGGRYGYGQLLLVGERLLIVTESGDLVVAEASPAGHRELVRLPALTGKSWSHPAIARNRLFVRNGAEAVAFELGASDGQAPSGPGG